MKSHPQQFLAALMCLGLALGAGACNKKTSDTSTGTTATTTGEIHVSNVDLGRGVDADKHVTQGTETFSPADVIYASVSTSGASAGATLKARWTFQDGQVVDESQQSIAPSGDATTEFHVSKPDGWPAGKYKVEILLNDTSEKTKEFEVK